MSELSQEDARALTLDPLHQITCRHVRRAGNEQVDMVLAHMTLENLNLQLRTDRSHDLAEPGANIASQQLLAVLRDPHQVELDVKARMRCSSVVFHPSVIPARVA